MQKKRLSAKHNKNTPSQSGAALNTALKSSFLGILITVGSSLAMLLATTAAALMTDDPTAFVNVAGFASLFVSSFIGGFVCPKLNKQAPYLVSLLCGAGFVALIMLSSLALPHSLDSGMHPLTRLCLYALVFALFPAGTIVAIKSSRPKQKRKIRR